MKTDGLSVIAEIKRRSPSAGSLNPDLKAATLARIYRDGGAACLSVLTEGRHFGGSAGDLGEAREASGLPVLRKDFITSHTDVVESREMGADALLLIVADIEPGALRSLHELAFELKIDVLTEIRNTTELKPALAAGAYMIVVNQRDRPEDTRFSLDYGKAAEIARELARIDGITKVAASGIGVEGGTPLREIVEAGYDAALIGEALLTAVNPVAKLRLLLAEAELGIRTE